MIDKVSYNKILLLLFCLPIIGLSQDTQPLEMSGMLEAHNEARDSLNLPELVWSTELEKSSLKWAKKLRRKNYCLYKHSTGRNIENIGENIAWSKGYDLTPRQVSKLWISEKKYFDFESRKCVETLDSCGHYTQIIWRDTKKVGCATVKCGDEQVWVCQYKPAGNVYFKGKILPAY